MFPSYLQHPFCSSNFHSNVIDIKANCHSMMHAYTRARECPMRSATN